MLGLLLLLVCVVKKIGKTVIIARLIVRLEGKLSSLGRALPTIFSTVPSHRRGTTEKWTGTSKFFGRHYFKNSSTTTTMTLV